MIDMVEQVARAIFNEGVKPTSITENDKDLIFRFARAAIAAMRECTPEMLDAGSAAHPPCGYKRETLLNDIIECEWKAMVDAALGDK